MMKYFIKYLKWEILLAWIVFLLFVVRLQRIAHHLIVNISSLKDYTEWGISDWLINYEGGFVRRGIIGQLLLWIEKIHLYDVRVAIVLITIVASFFMMILMYRMFKNEGWALLILPSGMCFGYTLFSLWGRRDLVSLMLTMLIFLVFRNLSSHPRKWGMWVFFYALSIFQLFMHEGSFFYTFPILMLVSYQRLYCNCKDTIRSIARCLLLFLPILLSMATVCMSNGDCYMAEVIWSSWDEVFTAFPSGLKSVGMGESVQALTWNAESTFIKHFNLAYFGWFNAAYWRALIVPFFMIFTYYLLTRLDSVNMGIYRTKAMNHTLMSNIAIVQFVSMLPMFTVLSCDWGRTVPYAVISSLFFYHIFSTDEQLCFPFILNKISTRFQHFISANRMLRSPYTYIILILVNPIPDCFAPFDSANIIQNWFIQEIQKTLTFVL